jgi:hypothetical protein
MTVCKQDTQRPATIEAVVGECTVTLSFSDEKTPDLKRDVLRQLTQCYEDRVVAQANN